MPTHFAKGRLANHARRARSGVVGDRRAFTLVEMLVVIVIIGILASLITVAAMNALTAAKQARIKVEVDQLAQAISNYKSEYGAFPPVLNYTNTANTPSSNAAAFRQHFAKAFPRSQETNFLGALIAANPTPAELLCFYLGGFSPDPAHPFTGGGVRTKIFDFDSTRLKPTRPIQIPGGGTYQLMAYYPPDDSTQPYLYFDTSRRISTDSSAVPYYSNGSVTVVPYMELDPQSGVRMVNPTSFQILSAGLDDDFGPSLLSMAPFPVVPIGPFTGAHADNLANFSPRNMEDSQP